VFGRSTRCPDCIIGSYLVLLMPPGLLYFSIRIKINADELGTCECSLLWVWFLEFLDFPARSVEGSKSKWKLIRWQVHLIWSEHTSIWSQLSGIIYRLHIRRCVFVARTPPSRGYKINCHLASGTQFSSSSRPGWHELRWRCFRFRCSSSSSCWFPFPRSTPSSLLCLI